MRHLDAMRPGELGGTVAAVARPRTGGLRWFILRWCSSGVFAAGSMPIFSSTALVFSLAGNSSCRRWRMVVSLSATNSVRYSSVSSAAFSFW